MTEARTDSDPTARSRRVVFVVGSGRSGSSALACSLQSLGMTVPQPEVPSDESNPKGFGESQWVVDFHDRLLRRVNVRVADARPQAWFDAGKLATGEKLREEVLAWLEGQYVDGVDEVVLKDPRLAWFLGLWRSATLRAGIDASHVIMLRPPTEVVGSKQKYYGGRVGEITRTACWTNHMLHTERATRGTRRSFIDYHQLLDDWTVPLYDLGERFDLQAVRGATAKDLRRVHDFIDPDLHRIRTTWSDLDVPKSLRAMTEETWHQLSRLRDPANDNAEVHATLDELRLEYTAFYEEAEAIAHSSVAAALNRRKRRGAEEDVPESQPPAAAAPTPAPAPPVSPTPGLGTGLRRRLANLGRRRES